MARSIGKPTVNFTGMILVKFILRIMHKLINTHTNTYYFKRSYIGHLIFEIYIMYYVYRPMHLGNLSKENVFPARG